MISGIEILRCPHCGEQAAGEIRPYVEHLNASGRFTKNWAERTLLCRECRRVWTEAKPEEITTAEPPPRSARRGRIIRSREGKPILPL